MVRNPRKPPRRLILGILFLAVSALTALSLSGPQWGQMTGTFGQTWVRFWAQAFGVPWVWLIISLGMLWGIALLARWPRAFLWVLSGLIWPLIIAWDAFVITVAPLSSDPLLHGDLGWNFQQATATFFGPDAVAHHLVALSALAVSLTILVLRYGLPEPISWWMGLSIAFVGRSLGRGSRLLLKLLGLVMRGVWFAFRGLVLLVASAASWLGRRVMRMARAAPGRVFARSRADELGAALARDADLTGRHGDELAAGSPAMPLAPAAEPIEIVAPPNPAALPGARVAAGRARSVSPGRRFAEQGRDKRRGSADVPTPKKNALARVPLDLLEGLPGPTGVVSSGEINRNAQLLKETLLSFGIEGEVSEVHPGPVITRYEFTPGVGVTISQIVSRQDDLALALRAPRVRLLAPIPGKAAVGVEIPNREPALISFKEVAATREFLDSPHPLPLALGKDVAGRPFHASLEMMPHLLVAGTTGSGKSVCLNTLIVSLLLHCTPERLRLLMIDPKMLELTTYNEIPHLARPVVTDSREAGRALRWLTKEMERRYRVLAGVGERSIRAYHQRRDAGTGAEPLAPMPYIVVFIDELADLMISNQADIELPIARLAQMARAVGIHLVLATQRPSVDVITGVIKANFPARIAFQVATRTDSRTVLDMNGAESLLGRGDMLFIPPGKAQAHRIHGAYLSDSEIERVVDYLRQFPPVEPLETETSEEEGFADRGVVEDPLFHEALRVVVAGQQGSTSMLQRRLRVGYTRAGRLMDMLEREGIVGPPDGSRARDVLVPPDHLEQSKTKAGDGSRR